MLPTPINPFKAFPKDNEHRVARLRKGLEILQETDPKDFDMDTWGISAECGTVTCAWGTIALSSYAKREGVICKWDILGPSMASLRIQLDGRPTASIQSAKEFFGLTGPESLFLFYPHDRETGSTYDYLKNSLDEIMMRFRFILVCGYHHDAADFQFLGLLYEAFLRKVAYMTENDPDFDIDELIEDIHGVLA